MKLRGNKKVIFCIKVVLFLVPFAIGTFGYKLAGEDLLQSMYSAVGLYLLNYAEVERNTWVEIARWLAPLFAVSGILMIMKEAVGRIKNFLLYIFGKAVVIYCEESEKQILKQNIRGSIFAKQEDIYTGVKDVIIMLSDDLENLNFYYKNEKKFENSNVYIRLEEMDSFLLKENKVKFFNETELIAKTYWKECNLLKYLNEDGIKVKIAIIGFEQLGQKLLSYGLMSNIYASKQQIEYHVWGESAAYEQIFSQIDLMNDDKVIFHGQDWAKDLKEFAGFDRIIVTQERNLELLQALLYVCTETEIDYYNKGEAELEKVFASENLRSFGTQEEVLTQKNIMSEELYRLGMELNYSYEYGYTGEADELPQKQAMMRESWNKLSGFLKASNIASADYHEIRLLILKAQGKKLDELEADKAWLSEAEHIRWSRFHFLNHWIYQPLEGARKDAKRRIHTCLVPFNELPENVKEQDWDTLMRLMHFRSI